MELKKLATDINIKAANDMLREFAIDMMERRLFTFTKLEFRKCRAGGEIMASG